MELESETIWKNTICSYPVGFGVRSDGLNSIMEQQKPRSRTGIDIEQIQESRERRPKFSAVL